MNELQSIISILEKHSSLIKAGYSEILVRDGHGELISVLSKIFTTGFEPVSFFNIENHSDYLKTDGSFIRFELKTKADPLYCAFIKVVINDSPLFAILIQGSAPFSEETSSYLECASAVLLGAMSSLKTSIDEKERESKGHMMSMRQMQAMLFPSFDNVSNLDVGAVYIPSQLLSGNFIDAFYISEEIYQVAVCSVSGYDATSSFVGSAVRTLVRSISSSSLTSSNMIEILIQKLSKIVSGVSALVTICVYQINTRNGRLSISSFGSLDTLLYVAKKKNGVSLNDTQIGKDLSKKNHHKEIIFSLEKGDSILFYSQGIINAETEDGTKSFGMSALWDKFKIGIELSSKDHVQNITQSVFEFINYAPLKDDLLLLRIKRI